MFRVVLQICLRNFYFKNNSERYYKESILRSFEKYLLFLSDFIFLLNFRGIFWQPTKTNFMKTSPVAEMIFHADTQNVERTDRHKISNYRFSHFCESA